MKEFLVLIPMCAIIVAVLMGFLKLLSADTSTPLSDYDLYGMDSEEYLKKQVGEEEYEKLYKDK